MQSLKELYKIGMGPSSSHTMGPRKAADAFNRTYPTAESFRAVLYGSLAATGKGHLTDFAIKEAFYPKPVTIEWEYETFLPKHPNAMRFEALDKAIKGPLKDKDILNAVIGTKYQIVGRKQKRTTYDTNLLTDEQREAIKQETSVTVYKISTLEETK